MNKQEIKRLKAFEEKCKKCPNYFEYRDKHYMKRGYCNSFKALYMHINDYTRCPYDKESD